MEQLDDNELVSDDVVLSCIFNITSVYICLSLYDLSLLCLSATIHSDYLVTPIKSINSCHQVNYTGLIFGTYGLLFSILTFSVYHYVYQMVDKFRVRAHCVGFIPNLVKNFARLFCHSCSCRYSNMKYSFSIKHQNFKESHLNHFWKNLKSMFNFILFISFTNPFTIPGLITNIFSSQFSNYVLILCFDLLVVIQVIYWLVRLHIYFVYSDLLVVLSVLQCCCQRCLGFSSLSFVSFGIKCAMDLYVCTQTA